MDIRKTPSEKDDMSSNVQDLIECFSSNSLHIELLIWSGFVGESAKYN